MGDAVTRAFLEAETAADFLAVWLEHKLLSPASQKLVDDYYRNFRGLKSERIRYWYNEQVRELEQFAKPGTRVLEVGVGTGTEFTWLAFKGASVVGIDAFRHCVNSANERLGILRSRIGRALDASVHLTPLETFKDEEGFDVIWMEQVFHHLEPRAQVVEKIASLLRPGGRVILSEANALNPLLQAQLFRARGFKMIIEAKTDYGTVLYGNERVLACGVLAKWLRSVGIEQETARYYRIFPSHPIFEKAFRMERAITSQWLAPIYSHYNFVGRKLK